MSHSTGNLTLTTVHPALSADPAVSAAPPDAALVAETLAGNRDAYGLLLRRYERLARMECFGVLKDWHAAQDAAQEAFIAAFTNLRSLREPAAFGGWLLTISRRRATRLLRSRRTHVDVLSVPEPAALPSKTAVDTGGVIPLIGRLPEHERVVVMLRYVDGHDVASIAVMCGRPISTVRKQLSRAHERLQGMLTKSTGVHHEISL